MSMIIGLTGQSGAGKTTVSKVFEEQGFGVINCDLISRQVTEAGSPCCEELAGIFPECFDDKLTLDRRRLGGIVFADREKLDILNRVIFKYINKAVGEEVRRLSAGHEYILLDAPTLFEAGLESKCSAIVAVTADEDTRLGRIISRDNISAAQARKRFNSQKSAEFFRQNCAYIIDNSGDIDSAVKNTLTLIDRIKERSDG